MKFTSKKLAQIFVVAVAVGSQALASEPNAPDSEPKAKVSESKGMSSKKLIMASEWVPLALELRNPATTAERRQAINDHLNELRKTRILLSDAR